MLRHSICSLFSRFRNSPRPYLQMLGLWFAISVLLAGCAPLEVRVVDVNSATEPAAAGQAQGEAGEELGPRVDPFTESVLVTAVAYLTFFAEACGALVIGIALVRAIGQFLRFVIQSGAPDTTKDDIRLRLARSLAVALEFALAADILKTAVAPTWGVIAQLGAIIVLRTLLNYFLEREIREVEERHERMRAGAKPVGQSPGGG